MNSKLGALIIVLSLAPAAALAKWPDKSQLDTPDLALCAAAAMKAGIGFGAYQPWAKALEKRYQTLYPKKTAQEIDAYTAERIIDKRKNLERQGLGTTPAFKKFYQDNCVNYHP